MLVERAETRGRELGAVTWSGPVRPIFALPVAPRTGPGVRPTNDLAVWAAYV
jgi:hypothetical protein